MPELGRVALMPEAARTETQSIACGAPGLRASRCPHVAAQGGR